MEGGGFSTTPLPFEAIPSPSGSQTTEGRPQKHSLSLRDKNSNYPGEHVPDPPDGYGVMSWKPDPPQFYTVSSALVI